MQQNKDGELKLLKQLGLFSLLSICLTVSLYAQSFDEFKKNGISAFEQYKDKRDAEFNQYLKAQWQEFTATYSKPLYKEKKPKTIKKTIQKKIHSVGPVINIKVHKVQKEKELVLIRKKPSKKDINFIFFGKKIGLNVDKQFKIARFYPQNQIGILNFFNTLASSNYESTLEDIKNITNDLALNDWALYQLIKEISKQLYSYEDERKLFSWFIFSKMSYDVKIGLAGKHIITMYYSDKTIYSTPSYEFNGKKFYVISKYAQEFSHSVYTYKQNYPDANKALDLSLKTLPKLEKNIQMKNLSFKQLGKKYDIMFKFNKNLIDFMATYPQADYETYFNSPISPLAYAGISQSLKKYINGKKASEAINFVLNFVQTAFVYEVDQKQFGREKVMFADETLFYNKSDCEDRAILFARLVKSLFGTTVIGVKYSDHMATALYIPLQGNSVKVGARNFVIADPTYIHANIGQSIPKYINKIPENFIYLNGE